MQPNTTNSPEPLPIAAALLAACLGPLVWAGCYLWFGNAYVAGLGIGLLIGLAVKFTSKRPEPALAFAAIGLTVLAAWIGFVWTEQGIIEWTTGPSLGQSIVRYLSDISALLFTALGAWIAYALAKHPAGVSRANP